MIDAKTNTIRKNPYRNEIDYILIRNGNNIRTLHSRSYANKVTTSDHKSVIAKIQIRWKDQPKHKHNRVLNIENLKNETIAENFNTTVKLEMQKLTTQPKTIQERWNKMTKILHTSADRPKKLSVLKKDLKNQ